MARGAVMASTAPTKPAARSSAARSRCGQTPAVALPAGPSSVARRHAISKPAGPRPAVPRPALSWLRGRRPAGPRCGAAACGGAACGAEAHGIHGCGAHAGGATAHALGACAAEACAAQACAVDIPTFGLANACPAEVCAINVVPIIPLIWIFLGCSPGPRSVDRSHVVDVLWSRRRLHCPHESSAENRRPATGNRQPATGISRKQSARPQVSRRRGARADLDHPSPSRGQSLSARLSASPVASCRLPVPSHENRGVSARNPIFVPGGAPQARRVCLLFLPGAFQPPWLGVTGRETGDESELRRAAMGYDRVAKGPVSAM